jgi:hypothetical protein
MIDEGSEPAVLLNDFLQVHPETWVTGQTR